MSQRRTRQSALEKRLGVSVVTSSMPAEPSHYRLLASWTFEQGMRWLQGDLYPHLRIKDVDEGESSVPQAPPSAWRVRLVTSHDKGHLHKCCGAVCMLNIIRHLVRLSWTSTFEPFDGWLAAHVGVALFSRFFRVAPRAERVADGTITEEVRWHALLFSLRNVAVLCAFSSSVQSAVPSAHMPARLEPLLGALICLPFHVAVDAATARHGAPGWSSIRSHASLPLLPAENTMRRMLSIMQFVNNHAMLYAGERRPQVAFALLGWVQLNAFCMTLRRKALLSPDALMRTYVAMSVVVTGLSLGLTDQPALSLVAGALLLEGRRRGHSKYALWTACLMCGLALGWVQSSRDLEGGDAEDEQEN